jgi:hypothetical protein
LKASGHVIGPSFDGATKDDALAQIGLQAVKLITARLVASMHSERAMALMRDNGKPMC